MLPGNSEDRPPFKGGRTLSSSLKTSVCDWDSPSSRTGTVRRKNTKNKMSSSTNQLSTKIPKTSKTASLRKLSPIAGTSNVQSTAKLNSNSSTNQITELFTDIPDLVIQQQNKQHKTPPPYKEPPTPPPLSQIPSLNGGAKISKQKQHNVPSGKVVFGKKERREMNSAGGAIKNCISKLTGSPSKHSKEKEEANIQAKLQNIPVRPRKTSNIAKEENYCLFDPSVDFINEKIEKKQTTKVEIHSDACHIDDTSPDTSEDIVEEIIYEDSQEIENKDYHNYFIIDPEDMLSENDEEIKVEVDTNIVEESEDVLPLVEQRRKLKFLNLSPMHHNNNSSSSTSTSTSSTTSSTSTSSSASLAVGGGNNGSSSFITYKLEKDIRNRTVPLVTYGSPYAVNRNVQYKKSSSKRPQSVHSDADSGFLSPCTPEDFKLNAEILAMEEWNNLQVYVEVGRTVFIGFIL